jgi:Zn finger protein HypA/HybF involved in hydrogenase expression
MAFFSSQKCPHCGHQSTCPEIPEAIVCPNCEKRFEIRSGRAVKLPRIFCPHCLKRNEVPTAEIEPYFHISCDHCGGGFKPYVCRYFPVAVCLAAFNFVFRRNG